MQPECRVALMVGIIGMVLKEHVFSELWFGGTDEQIGALEALQERQKDGDGESGRIESSRKLFTDMRQGTSGPSSERKPAIGTPKILT